MERNRTRYALRTRTAHAAPGSASRELVRGEKALESGNLALALCAAKSILRRDRDHLGALELLARVQWRQSRFEPMLETIRHLVRLNPYEPGYHYLRGCALQSLGHSGAAIQAFSRCLESQSDGLRRSAAQAIRELESWQESLVADMLREDAAFRSAYRNDPMRACHKLGFRFAAEDPRVAVLMAAAGALAPTAPFRDC
jgi:tetratricopeptide (TPR) repeat protein